MIDLLNVSKSYKELEVLSNISVSIQRGERVAFIAPSGAGKSTLMRVIAGIEETTGGSCLIDGTPSSLKLGSVRMAIQDRDALPWMTVYDNILLSDPKGSFESEASDLLQNLGLTNFSDSWPSELSGGMRKRLALGRCLLGRPEAVILDEAFASLDWPTRRSLHNLTIDQIEAKNTTLLLVSHDLHEVVQLANRAFVFSSRPMRMIDEIDIGNVKDKQEAVVSLQKSLQNALSI